MNKSPNPPLCPAWSDFPEIELYMDQVVNILERFLTPYFAEEKAITPTMVNNYVKQKLISPPQNKRYTKGQLTRIFMICILKSFLQLSEISQLLENRFLPQDDEKLFALFSRELDGCVTAVFQNLPLAEKTKNPTERALQSALMAFASILYARKNFRIAAETWEKPKADTEKETKKENKEKEKKEKKEKKKQ